MTGKTHAACGAATMLALTVLHRSGLPIGAETYTPALGLLTVVVGSYAPDVDLKNSTLGEGTKLPHLIYVGDSEVDIQTAWNCRMNYIGVSWGFRGRKKLKEVLEKGGYFVEA